MKRALRGRLLGKAAWPAAIVALWLLPPLLAVEIAVRAADALGQHDGFDFFQNATRNIPAMYPATPDEARRVQEISRFPTLRESAPPPQAVRGDASAPAAERFWRLYRDMTPDDRAARAALAGEYWRLLRPDGEEEVAFGNPEVEWLKLLRWGMEQLEPGESRRFTSEDFPLWDYQVEHLRVAPPGGGAEQSLYHVRSLTENLSFEQLHQMFAGRESLHVLAMGFIYQPNFPWPTITDQFGFPNPPVEVPKPGRTIRILCIGGSTMEDYGQEGFRATAQLNALLAPEFPDWKIEVLNCAISSASSDELRRHARDYLRYQPDLVIYYEAVNDVIKRISRRRWEDLWWPQRLLLQSHAAPALMPGCFELDKESFRGAWQRTTRVNLLAVATAMKDAGVPFAAMSFVYPRAQFLTWRQRNYLRVNACYTWGSGIGSYPGIAALLDEHNALLKELCTEKQFGYIPLAENFDHGMDCFMDLCHLTPLGNQERARLMHLWVKPWVEDFIARQGGAG